MNATEEKLAALRRTVNKAGGMAIAFSGGVDSTFLAAVAVQELGDRALAVMALSPTYPSDEQEEAVALARHIGIPLEMVTSNELEIDGFCSNPPDRCYHCKRALFAVVGEVARKHGLAAVADGSNADDVDDYRPGRRALRELGVRSPLLEAGLTKSEIRQLSRQMGLPTADKPAMACLASRFPYGSAITEARLKAVEQAERNLHAMGCRQVRVRHHGATARIEVDPAEIERLCAAGTRDKVVTAVKKAGFTYVALDLQGYRTGSMNETLDLPQRRDPARPGNGPRGK